MPDEAALSFPILLTLRVCVACVLLYLCVGLPCARFCSRRRGLLARALAFLVTLPLIFPPVAMGFLLLLLLGRNGPIGGPMERWLGLRIVFSEPGVILSAFVAGLPLVVRPLQAAMERPELRRLEEAARTLGCGTMGTFLFVTVPQVSRTLFSCLLLGAQRAGDATDHRLSSVYQPSGKSPGFHDGAGDHKKGQCQHRKISNAGIKSLRQKICCGDRVY